MDAAPMVNPIASSRLSGADVLALHDKGLAT
jgi:hypothetical protein